MTLKWSNRARSSDGRRALSRVRVLAALVPAVFAAAPAFGQDSAYRGVDIFDAVCANCHISGEEGAPRIGDRAAWAKRAEQGLAGLTRNTLEGIRSMPAHGGNASLSHLELQRAIVYIVNESGGNWVEPTPRRRPGTERSGAQVVQSYCVLCHASGFENAPRIGDRAEWARRTKLGIDPLVRAAIRGHGAMPPRGGQANLTDAELRGAVIYMASSASARAAADRKANPGR